MRLSWDHSELHNSLQNETLSHSHPHTNGVGSLTVRYSDTFRKISVSYRNGIGKSTSKEFILRNNTLVKWKSYTVRRYLRQELCFHKFIFKRLPVSLHDKGRYQPIPMFNCRSKASDSTVHALGPNYTLLHRQFFLTM